MLIKWNKQTASSCLKYHHLHPFVFRAAVTGSSDVAPSHRAVPAALVVVCAVKPSGERFISSILCSELTVGAHCPQSFCSHRSWSSLFLPPRRLRWRRLFKAFKKTIMKLILSIWKDYGFYKTWTGFRLRCFGTQRQEGHGGFIVSWPRLCWELWFYFELFCVCVNDKAHRKC